MLTQKTLLRTSIDKTHLNPQAKSLKQLLVRKCAFMKTIALTSQRVECDGQRFSKTFSIESVNNSPWLTRMSMSHSARFCAPVSS